jgi:hypothetical protein
VGSGRVEVEIPVLMGFMRRTKYCKVPEKALLTDGGEGVFSRALTECSLDSAGKQI